MNQVAVETIEKSHKEEPDEVTRPLLPIRTADNVWVNRQLETKEDPAPLSVDAQLDVDKKQNENEFDVSKIHSVAQLVSERRKLVHKLKLRIGGLATNILKDPTQISNLSVLLGFMKEDNPLISIYAKKCASLTLLQVFSDILPGYKVAEDIFNQKLKKDTVRVVREELAVVQHYSAYLKHMEANLAALNTYKNDPAIKDLAETSLHCFGELLLSRPVFNYSDNIINLLVPYLNHKVESLREKAFFSLSSILKNDTKGVLSLKIIKRVYKFARSSGYRLHPTVLKLFLHLRLKELKNTDSLRENDTQRGKEISRKERLIKKMTEKFEQKPSKRQKREKKKMAKLREQMGTIQKQRLSDHSSPVHSEILEMIFGVYIHILKKKPKSKLMTTVLEGLANYAHLINIEFFSDLLKNFSTMLEERTLDYRASLHCLETVFTILSSQGDALTLDPLKFITYFYHTLFTISDDPMGKNVTVAINVLNKMLLARKKKVSNATVMAFTKRLASVLPALSHHSAAVPTLVALRSLFVNFPCNEALLDADPDGSPGTFSPDVQEPDHANAISTAVWELHTMKRHYHPDVRKLSSNILDGCSIKGNYGDLYSFTKCSAKTLYEKYEPENLLFMPPPADHSGHLKSTKSTRRKRKMTDSLDFVDLKLQMNCEDALAESAEQSPLKRAKLNLDYFAGMMEYE